jgi:hypothetical protein
LIALAIAVVILAGGAGASVFAYYNIKGQATRLQAQLTVHLQAGQNELEAAKASLKAANNNHDQTLIAQANVHFTTAKLQFMVAKQMADSSGLLQQLEFVPAVGDVAKSRQVAVDGIADMGVAVSDAGLELAKLDGQLINPAGGGQQGRNLLAVLQQTQAGLVAVRADLVRAQKAAAQVDVHVLPASQQATLNNALATLNSGLAGIDEFNGLIPAVTEMLGGNGARNYLIEQVNPAELRPGGGFIGTFSVLRADHGALTLVRSGDAYQISDPRALAGQPGYVTPPGPLRESLSGKTSWSFVDSNFFPDFPSNAKMAEQFAQPRLGMNIDAVMAIDYYAVAKMLELTGPMAVPNYGITVNSSNFISMAVYYDLTANDAIHKGVLSAIAGPLLAKVSSLPSDRWPALISALNELSASRHFQVYFNTDVVQKQMNAFGWSGDMNVGTSQDYMMEVESNLGATKANYFLTRHFTVELTLKGGLVHHKVTIDLVDNMPFSYHPGEYYHAYLRLYVPASASSAKDNLVAVKYPNPAPPSGTRMIDGWVPLFHGYGHSAQAVFEFDTPLTANGRGVEQLYWQKQPGTDGDKFDIVWHDGSGHTYTTTGNLTQDQVITLSARGVGVGTARIGQAVLPSLSLG